MTNNIIPFRKKSEPPKQISVHYETLTKTVSIPFAELMKNITVRSLPVLQNLIKASHVDAILRSGYSVIVIDRFIFSHLINTLEVIKRYETYADSLNFTGMMINFSSSSQSSFHQFIGYPFSILDADETEYVSKADGQFAIVMNNDNITHRYDAVTHLIENSKNPVFILFDIDYQNIGVYNRLAFSDNVYKHVFTELDFNQIKHPSKPYIDIIKQSNNNLMSLSELYLSKELKRIGPFVFDNPAFYEYRYSHI